MRPGTALRDNAAQGVRFLLVGATNTAVGLGAFALLFWWWGDQLHYLGALVVAYAIGTVVGFVLYRRFVFVVDGPWLVDFVRYTGVQATALLLNAAVLPVLVETVGLPVLPGQAVSLAVVVVASYFGHKLVSFRRPVAGSAGAAGLAGGDDDRGTERQVDAP